MVSTTLEDTSDWALDDAFEQINNVLLAAWSYTSRRLRLAGACILLLYVLRIGSLCDFGRATNWIMRDSIVGRAILRPSAEDLPSINLDYSHGVPQSPFNTSKLALLVENRPNPILAPLMLHYMAVVPPDWRFRFMGSLDSVASINSSVAIRQAVASGKLDLTYIPANMSTESQEMISRFLTNLWLYETVLQPAEWLLVFQTDSILCANSQQSLNDWLDYDWVGAPWSHEARFGGNGGLSLRRVSAMIDVLRNQEREDNTEPEDVWLTERLGHRPNAKLANGTLGLTFSGEMHAGNTEKLGAPNGLKQKQETKKGAKSWVKGIDDWRDGFYEPMGYHTGGSGVWLHSAIWGTPELRKHIWDYCPEVKMTLQMDAEQFVPGDCASTWKRGVTEGRVGSIATDGSEMEQYPMLPPGLMPW